MAETKTALISGARGQMASYLADLLLDKGYKVVAFARRVGQPDNSNIQHLLSNDKYVLEHGDLTDSGSLSRLVSTYKPNEIYNLAAQSHVHLSWDQPSSTCDIDFTGVANLLEVVRQIKPDAKVFHSSTSEVFGDVVTPKQNEESPIRPRSPYGAAKAGAEFLVKVYRESYGMYICYARLFNTESPRRGKEFVTRKITSSIAEQFAICDRRIAELIKDLKSKTTKSFNMSFPTDDVFKDCLDQKLIQPIKLGNLDAKRDWNHAKDTVRGIWMTLQQEGKPFDFVFGSGQTRTIREFLDAAYGVIGIGDWEKMGLVTIDKKFVRPAEVNVLCADAMLANTKLGWKPEVSFKELVQEMVESDMKLVMTRNGA